MGYCFLRAGSVVLDAGLVLAGCLGFQEGLPGSRHDLFRIFLAWLQDRNSETDRGMELFIAHFKNKLFDSFADLFGHAESGGRQIAA